MPVVSSPVGYTLRLQHILQLVDCEKVCLEKTLVLHCLLLPSLWWLDCLFPVTLFQPLCSANIPKPWCYWALFTLPIIVACAAFTLWSFSPGAYLFVQQRRCNFSRGFLLSQPLSFKGKIHKPKTILKVSLFIKEPQKYIEFFWTEL